ncbi:MAG: VanZ family protein [Parcubacteria group bacterium Athens0714_25]|nr:MAG: VanZ family protein [Parcubacteria group bacterium Athens0714_25]
MKFFFQNYFPLLLWLGIIFLFSSVPGGVKNSSPDIWFYAERKGAHVFEYFVLALLFVNLLRRYYSKKKLFFLAGFFSLAYAFSDEFHQTFIFGREGKISDTGIDLIGIILGLGAVWFFWKNNKKES